MEGKISRTICIFPGRFQPFSYHHYEIYSDLTKQFGTENVFIAPTKTQDNESNPLSPEEKIIAITAYGVPYEQIVFVTSPYKAEEILSQFDSATTCVVFAYGSKDSDRINFTKKDGSQSWFKPYSKSHNMPFSIGGYAYIVPTISLGGNILNSSSIRDRVRIGCDYISFCKMMRLEPFPELWNVYTALTKTGNAIPYSLSEGNQKRKRNKHIMHLWEDSNLTYSEVLQIIKLACTNSLPYCVEKFDGQNLLVTVKNGEVFFARSKGDILNPLSQSQLEEKFFDRPIPYRLFNWAANTMRSAIRNCNQNLLSLFIPDNSFFLNIEIIYNPAKNVIDYGSNNIVVHSINRYDESGLEISRIKSVEPLVSNINVPNIVSPNFVSIHPCPEVYSLFKRDFNDLWNKYKLNERQTLWDLYSSIAPELSDLKNKTAQETILRLKVYPIVEVIFSKAAVSILKNCTGYYNYGKRIDYNLSSVRGINTEPDLIKQMQRISKFGGLENSVPFEGIVFEYNDEIYKMTGLFAPINQILGFWRYKK